MVDIELDGKKVSVPEGSMVMHAADAAGTYIPHFCYHKKLSIAANCRMCLVDVEKAPKPMPACATPVTQGMIVRTKSDKALKAQQSVMEFLLINHPLDCPICDQGGECQLQDLAVGYGGSSSRYQEEKRVVFAKDVGPIISMEEMSRCIHCTRCVRFGQEVAGVMELGMVHRGEHSEITTIAGETIDSELSGNMIDICPVGALTSKPFRYSARTWELSRRKSVSPHDSVGANLIVQVKNHRVMRVVPLENEAVNECWIADRDRFSYEAFNSDDRLTAPMIKQGGEWKTVDWTTALDYVVGNLSQIRADHGPAAIGLLGHGSSTNEELYLLGKLGRALADGNVDHRLRHADPGNLAPSNGGARWLGMPIAGLSDLQRAWVIGGFIRKDHPLFAQRLRQATKKGCQVLALNASHDDWLMPVAQQWSVAPDHWVEALAQVAMAVAEAAACQPPDSELIHGRARVVSAEATRVAQALISGERKAILLGNAAVQHPQASLLQALADWIAQATGATLGSFGDAGNSVGAQAVGAVPDEGAASVREMLQGGMKALVLLNVEPALDFAAGSAALRALGKAHTVIALTPFKTTADVDADVLLPITPFTETAGSFVNAEGRLQGFHGVVKPQGDARPGWKVLRVLGSMLGLPGFDFNSSEEVLKEALPHAQASVDERLSNEAPVSVVQTYAVPEGPGPASGAVSAQRLSHVPIYSTDAAVRRSAALQATADAGQMAVRVGSLLWTELGMQPGDRVEVTGDDGVAVLPGLLDPSMAAGVARLPAGHKSTASVGPMFGQVRLSRVPATVATPLKVSAGAAA